MPPNKPTSSKIGWQLFWISVLGLFLEMLLIRWIATEIRIFAYLQNTVLVVCFLGLGMGCFTCRREVHLRQVLVPLLILATMLAIPLTREALGSISLVLSSFHDFVIWSPGAASDDVTRLLGLSLGLALTLLLLFLLWDIFVPIGRLVGRMIEDHPMTIRAYSLNVAGSLLGTWLFVGLSVFQQPPVTWMLVLSLLAVPFLGVGRQRWSEIGLLAACIGLVWLAGQRANSQEVRWSPYQKLVLTKSPGSIGTWNVLVNNTDYQEMIDQRPERLRADPELFSDELRGYSQYDVPWLLHPDPDRVLIVGSGAGNDVAGALRNDVRAITAVEIDPVIIGMGRRFHPERPYSSPSVQIVNDDARSYFGTCSDKFAVISFGLLDSHTSLGGTTSGRLDHFVYTRESLRRARELLADDGILVMTFFVRQPYIADRMAGQLRSVFGTEPLCFVIPPSNFGRGGFVAVAGNMETINRQLVEHPRLARHIAGWQRRQPVDLTYDTRLTTDDWPYLYLDRPRIPVIFYLISGLMAITFLRGRWRLSKDERFRGWNHNHWHFFFLGAAFMLLEVQNISKACAVLGSTWWVNAVIVSGVLVMVLLANAITARFAKLPLMPVYAGLCAACVGLFFVDFNAFAGLPFGLKAITVGGVATLPLLFSGIVFVRSLVNVPYKDQAFGANMLGALVGGLLQWMSYATGMRALLILVVVLYVLALITRPKPGTESSTGNLPADVRP